MEKSRLSFQSFAAIAVSAMGKLPPVLAVWENLKQFCLAFSNEYVYWDVATLCHMIIVVSAYLLPGSRKLPLATFNCSSNPE